MPNKILIVDDEPHLAVVIRQVFRKRIKDQELEFLFAADGEQALSLLADNAEVAMVFTDINMPNMNGLTLLKNLNENHPLLKTVVITAYGDMKNIRSAMNHGAFDFLNKPINFNDLKLTLDKTLAHVNLLRGLHCERQQRFLAEKLRTLIESLTVIREPDKVYEHLVHAFMEVLAVAGAVVCQQRAGTIEILARINRTPDAREVLRKPVLKQFYTRLLRDREAFFTSLDDAVAGADSALLCQPLFFRQGGPVMVVLDRGGPQSFSSQEHELVQALCNQATVAIENARLYQQVQQLTIIDSLTGLWAEHHFRRLCAMELKRSHCFGNPLVALVLTLDDPAESVQGPGPGSHEIALEAVAGILEKESAKTDILGRIDNTVLAALLIETKPAQATTIVERLRTAIAVGKISSHGESLNLSVSVGMAVAEPFRETGQELLDRAGRASEKALSRDLPASE